MKSWTGLGGAEAFRRYVYALQDGEEFTEEAQVVIDTRLDPGDKERAEKCARTHVLDISGQVVHVGDRVELSRQVGVSTLSLEYVVSLIDVEGVLLTHTKRLPVDASSRVIQCLGQGFVVGCTLLGRTA